MPIFLRFFSFYNAPIIKAGLYQMDKKYTDDIRWKYCRGDYNEHSDVDIMILSTLTDEEIEEVETEIFDLAFDFQMDYDIDISVVIQNKERFNYWLGALPFYNNVQKEGIVF